MNLLNLISLKDLKTNIQNKRINFLNFEENKISFKFMYDVYRESWVDFSIAGKYNTDSNSFHIIIGLNQSLDNIPTNNRDAYLVKIRKEFEPFNDKFEKILQLNIIEFLLANPNPTEHPIFFLNNKRLTLLD